MKTWYQLRVEEIDIHASSHTCILVHGISNRLRRWLLKHLYFGGLRWQYIMGHSEWRGFYGSTK